MYNYRTNCKFSLPDLRDFSIKMPGGHNETFYTLGGGGGGGGASHVPICSHIGGHDPSWGERATFRGCEVPSAPL